MGKRTKGPSKIDHSIYETHITFSEYRWIINGGSNSFHSLKAPVSTDEDAALLRALYAHVMMYNRDINIS